MLLIQGISITIAIIIKNKSWKERSLPDRAGIQKLIRYSISVLLFNVLLFGVYRVDYYFVKYSPVCSASDLGNYIQASKLGQMMLVVPQVIGSAIYPQVSSGLDMGSVSRTILLLIKGMAIVFVIAFVVVSFTGKWLFPFLFGHSFQHIQIPLLILLPGIYGLAVISILSNFFSGKGNVRISVKAAFTAFIVVLCGDFLLVPRYGIASAAGVSTVAYLVMLRPYLSRFSKDSGIAINDIFKWNKNDVNHIYQLIRKRSF